MAITIDTITDGTLLGTGYFDKFMKALDNHIQKEAQRGRLQGPEFATVYLGAMQLALQQAVQYASVVEQVRASGVKSAAEVALLDQKTLTEEAQIKDILSNLDPVTGAIGQQKSLQLAQQNGFSRDAEQKAVKIMMDAWSIQKSVGGDAIDAPDGALNPSLSEMIVKLRQGIQVTESIYKFAANAGPDQSVSVSSTVQLDGTNSTYPGLDGQGGESISVISWVALSGPGGVLPTITGSTTLTPTFNTSATPGEYRIQLQLTGSISASSIDEVKITTT